MTVSAFLPNCTKESRLGKLGVVKDLSLPMLIDKKINQEESTDGSYLFREDYIKKLFEDIDDDINITYQQIPLFNEDQILFNEQYIDAASQNIIKEEEFKSKLIGKISFFNETTNLEEDGTSVFPKLINEPDKIYLWILKFQTLCLKM